MEKFEKNLLDLKHSLFSTKGSILFTIGIAGGLSILFGSKDFISPNYLRILISIIWILIFGGVAINFFNKCEEIHTNIKEYINLEKR